MFRRLHDQYLPDHPVKDPFHIIRMHHLPPSIQPMMQQDGRGMPRDPPERLTHKDIFIKNTGSQIDAIIFPAGLLLYKIPAEDILPCQ